MKGSVRRMVRMAKALVKNLREKQDSDYVLRVRLKVHEENKKGNI